MVPDGWEATNLEECADILDSRRVPLNADERRARPGSIPYYGANGVVDYVGDHLFDEPLVLIAEDGGYFDEFATRPIAQRVDGKAWVNNHAHVLRARGPVLRDWLFFWFVHRDIRPSINSGTRSKLNQADLRRLPLLVPPLEEQRRIAAVLQAADDAVAAAEAVIEQTEKVKRGLVEQLLTRGMPGRHTRFKMTEIGEVPESWEVVPLEAVVSAERPITYGIVQAGPHVEGGVPYIRVSDMSGRRLTSAGMLRTSAEIAAQYKRSTCVAGDIVFALRGRVGDVKVLPHELDGANLTQGTARIAPGEHISSAFLLWVLRSSSTSTQTQRAIKGSTFKEISLGALRKLLVPVPLPVEQAEIVSRLTVVDEAEELAGQAKTRAEATRAGLAADLLSGRVRVPA